MGKVKEAAIDTETGEVTETAPKLPAVPEKTVPGTVADIAPPKQMQAMPVPKLATAISKVMGEIAADPIHKKGKNAFHNYSYATMQDILSGLTPLMSKHGITIMQTEIERGFMDNGNAIFATYDFTIMHESGEVWPFPQRQTGVSNTRTSKGTFDDKGLNKCHTSARKYFLLSLFQIPTTDEDDADRGDNDGYGAKNPKPRPAAPPLKKVTKATPHEIPRPSGIKAVDWGRELVEQFKLCEQVTDLDAWLIANEEPLAELKDRAPGVYERVMDVEKTRRNELAPK
jgi:hypothetical protein